MDLGQIEAYLRVAEHRNFSRAAEDLGLTQPSVTARIQTLERDLGESLFERNGRGVRLTEVGESFLPHAKRVLKALHDGQDAVLSMRKLELGTLRIGAAPTISTYVLPELLKEFNSRYPGLEISVRTEYSQQIVQMVLADEVQMGLERGTTHPEVETIPLYGDEVVLVASAKDDFAARGSVSLADVAKRRLIMFNRGSSYYALVDNALREAGLPVSPAMELDSADAACADIQPDGCSLGPLCQQRQHDRGSLVTSLGPRSNQTAVETAKRQPRRRRIPWRSESSAQAAS